MGLPRGLRGTTCQVCQVGIVKTQDALTCSPACGVELKRRQDAQPAGVELRIPLSKFRVPVRQECEASIARAEIADAIADASKAARKYPAIKRGKETGKLLEINIPDLHAGKLAWAVATGDSNYDVNIAIKIYKQALQTLLERTAVYKFDKILLVMGNDLLNADNLMNATTKGTVVTTDVRFHRTFARVREVMVETIERLREIAPVHVIMVPGNHDTLSVWHLGDSLQMFFHNCPDVEIENSPLPRKYFQFGKVMLMFTHGNGVKRAEFPNLMACEQPKMWGDTLFRETHTGHLHQTRLDERHGVRVRILPALCSADAWHADNGYVGNLKSAEAYVWDSAEGLVGTAHFNVVEEPQNA